MFIVHICFVERWRQIINQQWIQSIPNVIKLSIDSYYDDFRMTDVAVGKTSRTWWQGGSVQTQLIENVFIIWASYPGIEFCMFILRPWDQLMTTAWEVKWVRQDLQYISGLTVFRPFPYLYLVIAQQCQNLGKILLQVQHNFFELNGHFRCL